MSSNGCAINRFSHVFLLFDSSIQYIYIYFVLFLSKIFMLFYVSGPNVHILESRRIFYRHSEKLTMDMLDSKMVVRDEDNTCRFEYPGKKTGYTCDLAGFNSCRKKRKLEYSFY